MRKYQETWDNSAFESLFMYQSLPSSMMAFTFWSKMDAAAPALIPYSTQKKQAKKEGDGLPLHRHVLHIAQPSYSTFSRPELNHGHTWLPSGEPGKCGLDSGWPRAWLPLGKSVTERKEWDWGMHRGLCYPTSQAVIRTQVMLSTEARSKAVLPEWQGLLPPLTLPPTTLNPQLLGCQEDAAAAGRRQRGQGEMLFRERGGCRGLSGSRAGSRVQKLRKLSKLIFKKSNTSIRFF